MKLRLNILGHEKIKLLLISTFFLILMLPMYSFVQASASNTDIGAIHGSLNAIDIEKTNDAANLFSLNGKGYLDPSTLDSLKDGLDVKSLSNDEMDSTIGGEPKLPETLDVGKLFKDNLAGYQKVWEPWLSKAAIHDIEISDDGEFFLVGGGYLYDNEIHVYRWNEDLDKYVRVWETGDQLIKGDVLSVAMGDTDNNNFLDIAASSADGHVYVFEQTHIYDPFTRTETRFDPVWKSPYLKQAWAVEIADTDKDFVKDIIVASWDGFVRWYEYRDHSGYPFSREHWIEYREVFKYPIEGHPQSMAITDLNGNGLDEIIVGTREGWVYVLENNGTVIDIEGNPFPLSRDNNYQLIWKNNQSLWYPIMKMDTGQLDDDRAQEVVLTARGQGVFVLDYDPEIDEFVFNKLTVPLESWEAPSTGSGYPLDHYVDWMTRSSGNVYGWDGRPEPDPYVDPSGSPGFSPTIFPYNTSMAQAPDGNYTLFDASASGTTASAILDFGKDEELTGDGRPGAPESKRGYDLYMYLSPTTPPVPSRISLYLSPDGEVWEPIPSEGLLAANTTMLMIDVDAALAARQWTGARYLNITVHSNGYFKIDAIKTRLLDRPLDIATSAIVGTVRQSWTNQRESDKIVVGTVDGKLLIYSYDSAKGTTTKIFDSYGDERYTLGGNVWDIVQVPVTKATTVPTFLGMGNNFVTNLTSTFGSTFIPYMVTWAKLHQLSDVNPIAPEYLNQKDVVITSAGNAYILRGDDYQYSAALTNRYFSNINALGATSLSIAFSTQSASKLYGLPLYAAVAYTPAAEAKFYDPANPDQLSNVKIALYVSTGASAPYAFVRNLDEIEVTRYLKTVLQKSQILPTMAFGDLNGDGYEDLVIANGKLYLLRFNGLLFELDQEYFKGINTKTSNLFRNPQLVDFDQDGDLDLILSYYDKPGIAYWVNIGTSTSPVWEFRRQDLINLRADTNLAYNNFTLFSIEHGESFNQTLRMMAYQSHSNQLAIFQSDFETHETFIVGVNPKISRIDLNIREGIDSSGIERKNFGYRILETWNTEGELKEWTQSIAIADLDGDGRREVIAGDFDNNIYVFEHLTNNTYKRAFRSPDLAQRINTTQSPYAYQQLLGISASFIRFEWQHVNLVTAGSDLDRDGKNEIIATAGTTIYIFEFTGRDDRYQLVWTTDLGATIWGTIFARLGITEFTALKTSRDMNYNGRGEFLAAAGPFLFIFESYGDNVYREIFMDSSLRQLLPGGHYYLPENGLLYYYLTYDGSSQLIINDVAVGNIIKDTPEQEIIIVGEIRKIWGEEHGFVYVMRNVGSTFYHETTAPKEITNYNPIYAIEIDDPDYDGHPDIIIGHKRGVDVLEVRELTDEEISYLQAAGETNPPTYKMTLQAKLTGSPNYPYISPLHAMNNESTGVVFPPNIQDNESLLNFLKDYGVIFSKDRINTRATEIIALHTTLGQFSGFLYSGTLVQVFVKNGKLHWSISRNEGKNWFQQGQLFTDADYRTASIFGTETFIVLESEPALYQAMDGVLYLAWSIYAYNTVSSQFYSGIILAKKSYDANRNVSPWTIIGSVKYDPVASGVNYVHPSVWKDPSDPLTRKSIGISYMNAFNSSVYLVRYTFGSISGSPPVSTILNTVPFIGTGANKTHRAVSIDVLYQDHGIGNGTFVLAFSGEKYGEAKGDLDIWVTTADLNFNWTSPVRVSVDPTTDAYPDLTQLHDEQGTLMVVWELKDRVAQGEVGVSYSKDGGITWREPDTLASIPEFMEFRYFPLLGVTLPVWRIFPSVVFGNFLITSPTITALPRGGFTYSFIASYDAFLLQKIPIAKESLKASAAQFAQSSQVMIKLVPITPPEADYSFYRQSSSGPSRTMPSSSLAYSQASVGYRTLNVISQGLTSSSMQSIGSGLGTQIGILGPVTVEQVLSSQGLSTISYLATPSSGSTGDESPSTKDYVSNNYAAAYVAPNERKTAYPSRIDGIYRNIFVGVNPDDSWTNFDFFEASNIAVGDSDGDGLREIALTSRNQVYLVELIHNTNVTKQYRQVWESGDFGIELTDIEMYDANGNGFEEIIISGEKGNIFAFEVDSQTLQQRPTTLQFIKTKNETSLNWDGVISPKVQTLAAVNLNGNTFDDVFALNLSSTDPSLLLFIDGDPNKILELAVGSIITSWSFLDMNEDGIIDLLAYGTELGSYGVLNLTQTLIDGVFVEMAPLANSNTGSSVRDIFFLRDTTTSLGWLVVFIRLNDVVAHELGSNTPLWSLSDDVDFNGVGLINGVAGAFADNNGSEQEELLIVDSQANMYIINPFNGSVLDTIADLASPVTRTSLSVVTTDVNNDGFDDAILALDGEILVAYDILRRTMVWNVTEDFAVDEQFEALQVRDVNGDGLDEIFLVSNLGFRTDYRELRFYTSFEKDPETNTWLNAGTPIEALNLTNIKTIIGTATIGNYANSTNVQYAGNYLAYPTQGDNVLMGPANITINGGEFGLVFKNPVSRIKFRFFYNISVVPIIQLFENETLTTPIHQLTLNTDNMPLTLEFMASDFNVSAFKAIKIVPQNNVLPYYWYLDELEMDILQSRSHIRSYDLDGKLSWEYSLGAQEINSFIINSNPEGLVSPIGLLGAAVDDSQVLSKWDARGFLAIDLMNGQPTFYGGIQVNAHGGITGRMMDNTSARFLDGLFFLSDGTMFSFQFLDALSTETLENVALASNASWNYKLSSSVEFIKTFDVNGDAYEDIIVVTEDGYVYAIDGRDDENVLWKTRLNPNPVSVVIGDFIKPLGVGDIFISFSDGTFVVLNGTNGLTAWKDLVAFNQPVSAINSGDRDGDGFDDILLGTKIKFATTTIGRVIHLSGVGDGAGGKVILSSQVLPAPAVKMQLGDDGSGTNGYLFVLGRSGYLPYLLAGYQLGTGGSLSLYFFNYTYQFMDFSVAKLYAAPNSDSLIAVTLDAKMLVYDNIVTMGTGPTFIEDLGMYLGSEVILPHLVQPLDMLTWIDPYLGLADFVPDGLDDVVVLGLMGVGYVSVFIDIYGLGGDPIMWTFKDASIRVLTNKESALVNYYPGGDSVNDLIVSNAEVAYIINGTGGNLLWMTSLPFITGDIRAVHVDTFASGEENQLLIGTEGGYILRFNLSDTTAAATLPVYVPWYARYHNQPITPVALLPTARTTSILPVSQGNNTSTNETSSRTTSLLLSYQQQLVQQQPEKLQPVKLSDSLSTTVNERKPFHHHHVQAVPKDSEVAVNGFISSFSSFILLLPEHVTLQHESTSLVMLMRTSSHSELDVAVTRGGA